MEATTMTETTTLRGDLQIMHTGAYDAEQKRLYQAGYDDGHREALRRFETERREVLDVGRDWTHTVHCVIAAFSGAGLALFASG